ncbi:YcnI family protein [Solwaraspora sp. WMMB335]|uniref:YcnI family copper-binding membrane protein n=1 Tax=Solwaraspora sp. WMMB335 TaxID=3404118 RepID=UPI003B92245B
MITGRRLTIAGLIAVFLLAGPLAGTAAAHVTVLPTQANPGETVTLTFRVPNEDPDASTVAIRVEVPTDPPITVASVRETAGWHAEVARVSAGGPGTRSSGGAVAAVTWTALTADAAIDGDNFQEFAVTIGPVPDVERVVFVAYQTYSDQQVVAWDQPPQAGADSPSRPAPVLWATGAAPADNHDHGLSQTTVRQLPGAGTRSAALALGLAIAALVVAVAALLLALAHRASPVRPVRSTVGTLPGKSIPAGAASGAPRQGVGQNPASVPGDQKIGE